MTDRHLTPDERVQQAVEDYRADVGRTLDAYEIEEIEQRVRDELRREREDYVYDEPDEPYPGAWV
jgi:hypothetical protein